MRQFIKLDPTIKEETQDTRAFYYLLLLVILFIYALTLYESPELRQPIRLIPYTLLFLLHGTLHWFSPFFIIPKRRLAVYLVLQVSLVVVLSWMSQGQAVSFGLTMALAGETVGMLENWRYSLIAVAGYLALLMFINYLIGGWLFMPTWLGTAVVMMVFILIYVSMFMRQMNARQKAQSLLAELETTHQQLAAYAQRVETLTLETERQRMARELHDTLAQGLAGLILQIEGLEVHLEQSDYEKVAQIAAQAKGRARSTLAEARQAIGDLRQQQTATIAEVITREVERFRQASGIPCDQTLPDPLAIPDDLGEHVVRCVGEGLANVMQHARATAVSVKVVVEDDCLQVIIHDNGQGFAADQIPAGHYGLIGLRERARLAGGTLVIDSQPDKGTVLMMNIPLEEENKA